MLIKKHIAAVTALLVACSTPLAAFAEGTLLTLGDAVAKAQHAAPRLQGADAALRAAEANVQMSGLRPNPTLSVEAENVLGSGRYAGFGGGEKTVSVSVPLELGGKRQARVRVAQAERTVAGIGARTAQADLTLQVTEAFVSLAQLGVNRETEESGAKHTYPVRSSEYQVRLYPNLMSEGRSADRQVRVGIAIS